MRQFAAQSAMLGAIAVLAGCEQSITPGAQEAVLRGTESSRDFGDYTVYFNALKTDQLTPEVASEYGIVRSKNRAMLNVSIHRKRQDGLSSAVTGDVSAVAVNANGQLQNVLLREITEGDAVYYIGELAVNDAEILTYTVDISPVDEPNRFSLRFQKQFFVD